MSLRGKEVDGRDGQVITERKDLDQDRVKIVQQINFVGKLAIPLILTDAFEPSRILIMQI
jgi:hypothetical protein